MRSFGIFSLWCIPFALSLYAQDGASRPEPVKTPEYRHLAFQDPDLKPAWMLEEVPPELRIDESPLSLKTRGHCLETIERTVFAHQIGRKIPDSLKSALRRLLGEVKDDLQLEQALLSALALLGDASDAPEFWRRSQKNALLREVAEPALVKWSFKDARETWLTRVKDKAQQDEDLLVISAEGLIALGQSDDRVLIHGLIDDPQLPFAVKFRIANALGDQGDESVEALAQKQVSPGFNESDSSEHRTLLAATLIRKRDTDQARQLALSVLSSSHQAARSIVFPVIQRGPLEQFRPTLLSSLEDVEPTIRGLAAERLLASVVPDELPKLGLLLGDESPEVRDIVRNGLFTIFQNPQYQDQVHAVISTGLKSEWPAAEEAIKLVAGTKDERYFDQLLQLLDHPSPRVHVVAAWGLRIITTTPGNLQKMTDYASKQTERIFFGSNLRETDFHRLSHLLECIAIQKFEPGLPILRKFLPKNLAAGLITRISAIWGLGIYFEGRDDTDLAPSLVGILEDKRRIGAEPDVIRFMAALSLGRLHDPRNLAKLEVNREQLGTPIGDAVNWSVELIKANAKPNAPAGS